MTPFAATSIALITALCTLAGAGARARGLPAVVGWLPVAIVAGLAWHPAATALHQQSAAAQGAMQACAHVGLLLIAAEAGRHARSARRRPPSPDGRALSAKGLVALLLAPPVLAVGPAWLVCRQWFAGAEGQSVWILTAFLTLALSATAVPVLVPIVGELPRALRSTGAEALTVAIVSDAAAWSGLVALSIVVTGWAGASEVAAGAGVLTFCLTVLPRVIRRLPAATTLPLLVAGTLGAGAGSELAGWHGAIGAVLFGWVLPGDRRAVDEALMRLQPLVHLILLPLVIVVAVTHAPVDATDPRVWLISAQIVVIAVACKAIPAMIVSRRAGRDRGRSAVLAALVNVRGATEIVIALIGVELLGIPHEMAAALVVVALVSTLAVAPALVLSHRRFEATARTAIVPVPVAGTR